MSMDRNLATDTLPLKMREIAEIELAIQGGTEKIETLGTFILLSLWVTYPHVAFRRTGQS